MLWSELFNKENEPSYERIKEYINTPLWDNLTAYLEEKYKVKPNLFYSGCSMDNGFWRGWNIKYKKGGKALCTIYPKEGYFIALIAIGNKEAAEADLLMPVCDKYIRDLYNRTKPGAMGKSLPLEVTDGNILRDVKSLIGLRAA